MPLLADAIVELGRKTLSNAINLATKWGLDCSSKYFGAEVIYGDTDSIFIKLPGRSVKEAFDFGKEFCDAVTASNPPPVQLKLEKVYDGSLMQTVSVYGTTKISLPKKLYCNGLSNYFLFFDRNLEKEILWHENRISRTKSAII